MRNIKFIILFILSFFFTNLSNGTTYPLFKIGSYFEFMYYVGSETDTVRYSGKVVSDTMIGNIKYQVLRIFNEPFMGTYNHYYFFDTVSNILYSKTGYSVGCMDGDLKQKVIGFYWPKGYVFNTCSDTMAGVKWKSVVLDTGTYTTIFNTGIPLRMVQRRDSIQNYGIRTLVYSQMFGFIQFYQSYGNPYNSDWYKIKLMGCVIDSIRYGSILLAVENINTLIPDKFVLIQNYPNPFNPITAIEFSLPKSTKVKLKLYNILGKEVSLLFEEKKSAGNYRYKFNGGALPSGVYFYRLETDYGGQTKKMILLK